MTIAEILKVARQELAQDNLENNPFDPIKECDEYSDWVAKMDAIALEFQINDESTKYGGAI